MADAYPSTERRSNPELRAIFPAACDELRPFFDPANQWAAHSLEHLALLAVKERFPILSAQEAYLVVTTAKRLFAAGKFPPAP